MNKRNIIVPIAIRLTYKMMRKIKKTTTVGTSSSIDPNNLFNDPFIYIESQTDENFVKNLTQCSTIYEYHPLSNSIVIIEYKIRFNRKNKILTIDDAAVYTNRMDLKRYNVLGYGGQKVLHRNTTTILKQVLENENTNGCTILFIGSAGKIESPIKKYINTLDFDVKESTKNDELIAMSNKQLANYIAYMQKFPKICVYETNKITIDVAKSLLEQLNEKQNTYQSALHSYMAKFGIKIIYTKN